MARKGILPGGTRGTLYEAVARLRLKDAETLLQEGRREGALYLAGYAIECLLKWAVTRRRNLLRLPQELETHDWDRLLAAAGLKRSLGSEPAIRGLYSELAERWGPELRYLARLPQSENAELLYQKLTVLYSWLEDHTL
jgi:HEPN domain-containing protein